MDRNALTEQRRESVIGLLKGMNIRKNEAGGFDKDSVYECMQQLCDLYEKNIEELETAYELEVVELKDKYQKYDDNNDLYVSLIMEAKKSSNEIINQAKNEVESILNEGKAQVAKQEQELEQMYADMNAERNALNAELNASREAVDAEKAAMKAEIAAEREKVTALKNKYTQQINSMEEEFSEIKTNILRTAGRMDSLKSKFPTDEETNWNVANDMDAVDFPVAEIGVEEAVASPAHVEAPPVTDPILEELTAQEPAILPSEIIPPQPEIPQAPEIPQEPIVTQTPAVAEEAVEEINFDNIQIDLPDLKEEPAEAAVEEISFEGLEELFKEDN